MLRLINRNFIKGVFRGVRPFSSNDDIIVDEYDSTEQEFNQNKPESDIVRLLPIPRHPIFPKHNIRFRLSHETYKFLSKDEYSNNIGAFVKRPSEEKNELESQFHIQQFLYRSIFPLGNIDQIYNIGAMCGTSFNKFDRTINLKPMQRAELIEVVEPMTDTIPFPLVKLRLFNDTEFKTNDDDQALLKILMDEMQEIRGLLSTQELTTLELFAQKYNMRYDDDVLNYVGVILSYMCDTHKVQHIFETEDISERIKRTAELASEHLMMRNSMKQLQSEAQAKMAKASEEHVYKEIFNLIKNKLGMDKDEKETLKNKYQKNLQEKVIPEHIQTIIDEEQERLMMTDKNSSEFHVIRTYLDWLTCLPYGIYTDETLDLKKAREILDRDHYGLKDVKDRILEFIAVSKLRGSSLGKILCFAGPPGVGKTSIAKSIAEALNRKYHRISLGGLDDVAELKGHRRTYIGAQPGKIISALKLAGSENPLILIDEIDKVGRRNYQGSPENALLEILDPQQNFAFSDHYMDTTIDLSKVLFICTANYPDDISPPLYDRMEVIKVQGYTAEEKYQILENYLYPTSIKNNSLTDHTDKFLITNEAKEILIRDYCREAGVRSLERSLNRILEKIAVKVVQEEAFTEVNAQNLTDYAGQPPFTSKKLFENPPSGVVMGLAYTQMGGSTLYIEVSKSTFQDAEPKASIKMTGNLKKVMEESIQIAYTYARKTANKLGNNYLDSNNVHIHVPEGATPKDGPSAGITITTALLSLAFDLPIPSNLAMTGEISLTGKVLAIGGLKEKIVAAKREGITQVIIPGQNKPQWEELSDNLKEGVTVIFADDYADVLKVCFPTLG